MIWLQFVISAVLVVAAAKKLADYGDVIAIRTKLGGMFVGTLLLAGATSLPEFLTLISSINQGVPSLAAGNIFGSNMFNMFMLAILDLAVRQRRILRVVHLRHAISGSLALLLGALAIFFVEADLTASIGWVGLDSIFLMLIYVGGLWILTGDNRGGSQGDDPDDEPDLSHLPSLAIAGIGFGLATVLLIFVTPLLVSSSAGIANLLGVSAGFIGVTLVAIVTSLPEVVTTISAVRLGAYDLAIGNLFGSNCFNIFALGMTDLFYRQGLFLTDISEEMTLAAALGLVLTGYGLFGNVAIIKRRIFFIEIDSILIFVFYFGGMWLLYSRGLVG